MQKEWQGQSCGNSIQARGPARSVSVFHQGCLLPGAALAGASWLPVLAVLSSPGYHAGLRAVSCFSRVLWVNDFWMG